MMWSYSDSSSYRICIHTIYTDHGKHVVEIVDCGKLDIEFMVETLNRFLLILLQFLIFLWISKQFFTSKIGRI